MISFSLVTISAAISYYMITRKSDAPMCPGKKHLRIFYRTLHLGIVYVIANICNDNVTDIVFAAGMNRCRATARVARSRSLARWSTRSRLGLGRCLRHGFRGQIQAQCHCRAGRGRSGCCNLKAAHITVTCGHSESNFPRFRVSDFHGPSGRRVMTPSPSQYRMVRLGLRVGVSLRSRLRTPSQIFLARWATIPAGPGRPAATTVQFQACQWVTGKLNDAAVCKMRFLPQGEVWGYTDWHNLKVPTRWGVEMCLSKWQTTPAGPGAVDAAGAQLFKPTFAMQHSQRMLIQTGCSDHP